MTRSIKSTVAYCLAAAIFLLMTGSAFGAIYKYRKNGVWHFTDNPTDVPAAQMAEVTENTEKPASGTTNLEQQLTNRLKPMNEIEAATLATVVIETTFGYGTGFFVTADGYIITNRHVIRQMKDPKAVDDPAATAKSESMQRFEAQIENEEGRLAEAMADLAQFRRTIDGQRESPTRKYNEKRYQEGLQRYRKWEASLAEHRRKLESERSALQETWLQQKVNATLAELNRTFTVYLADNTPLYAYLVEISDSHDLALLKVDGYTTPFLIPENPYSAAQGDPVYAIGNPVKLRNSVASGVVSGFEGIFVKTNAQIYPGNSGGPLVTGHGRVIGVNTFKKLTHKFEGLGFAISITVAFDTFDAI
ncbi:MAG: trypsin-like peptidase domain-containing protein [Desulfosarcina sp.]|nr:trypsin-like peptidase domain-containing protein [Desulfosarcina sp.]MBC2745336.1 trypsin-like peptidase domain-containing protein [Desulfosarcina sp.]MBC2768241.1 trypsin-like serine protease [Desulfosarcina sp.]